MLGGRKYLVEVSAIMGLKEDGQEVRENIEFEFKGEGVLRDGDILSVIWEGVNGMTQAMINGTLRNQESRAREGDPHEDTQAPGCTWRAEE